MVEDALTVQRVFMFAERGDKTVFIADLQTKVEGVPLAPQAFTTILDPDSAA